MPDRAITTLYLDEDRWLASDELRVDGGSTRAWSEWDGQCQPRFELLMSEAFGSSNDRRMVREDTCDDHDNLVSERYTETDLVVGLDTQRGYSTYVNSYAGDRLTEQVATYWDDTGAASSGSTTTFAYDADDHLIATLEASDWGSESCAYTWTDGLLSEQACASDWGATTLTQTYDELGRAESWEYAQDYSGSEHYWSGERYAYTDDTPRVTVTETSSDEWATADETRVSTWTCPG